MLMTNQQSAKLAEPGVGSLYDPSPLVAAEFTAVFVSPFLVVAPVRCYQFNASLAQPLTQLGCRPTLCFRFHPFHLERRLRIGA